MRRLLFLFSIPFICSCQTQDDIYGSDSIIVTDNYSRTNTFPADSFNIPFRIEENSLGYVRVRTHPTFHERDTSNLLARIKSGTRIHAMIPLEYKDEWYYEEPYHYAVRIKNKDGKECLGYICKFVLIPEEQFILDSICDAKQNACPDSDTGELIVRGVYKGKNLWLTNPLECRGTYGTIGYVQVNNFQDFPMISTRLYHYESLHEVKLEYYNLEIGDSLKITITHEPCTVPTIVNPEDIQN